MDIRSSADRLGPPDVPPIRRGGVVYSQAPDGRAFGHGQVGGEHDEYVNAIHPDDRHLVAEFHHLADRCDSFPAEYRIVRADGGVLWLAGRGLVACSAFNSGRESALARA